MRLDVWLPMYREICRDFGYKEEDDMISAAFLSGMLERDPEEIIGQLAGEFPRSVVVCGCGDMLAEECASLSDEDYIVAADGATSEVLSAGLIPRVIVTDLDGLVDDQIEASLRGSAVFIHAHGDNVAALGSHAPQFGGSVVGTCQCPPIPGVVNMGGFTDGDRAVCIAQELGARRVLLAGFDLSRPSYKEGKDLEVKARKLGWARRILDVLCEGGLDIDFVRDR